MSGVRFTQGCSRRWPIGSRPRFALIILYTWRPNIERQRYLEIRDRRNRELVAVVELLSPVNKKSGPYRAST